MSSSRYATEIPFPAYAFVPGQQPRHEAQSDRAISVGSKVPTGLTDLIASPQYLYAVDLFNAGYYWEAHEEWEELWVAVGRTGLVADLLKGLIKLAAAGVKCRQGQVNGVARHARRAAELLRGVPGSEKSADEPQAGLALGRLIDAADQLVIAPFVDTTPSVEGRAVLGIRLVLKLPD